MGPTCQASSPSTCYFSPSPQSMFSAHFSLFLHFLFFFEATFSFFLFFLFSFSPFSYLIFILFYFSFNFFITYISSTCSILCGGTLMNLEDILKLEHICPNMKHFSFEPGAYFSGPGTYFA